MNDGFIERPKVAVDKIQSKEHFELCYLRHQYFRRANYNPSKEEVAPYKNVIFNCSKNTYYTYQNLLKMVGMDLEDVVSIGNVHLVSFLGLFSMERMPEKYKDFVAKFRYNNFDERDPDENDILSKNKAIFTIFLKQRMEDLIRICKQKARNIKGLPVEEYQPYYGSNPPPKPHRMLLEGHEKYGFRKLDLATFKTIKKKIKEKDSLSFKFQDVWYVAVPIKQKNLNIADFAGADLDPHDNIHYMDPERTLFLKEDTDHWSKKAEVFKTYPDEMKIGLVRAFIKDNVGKREFKEEINIARKMLANLGGLNGQ